MKLICLISHPRSGSTSLMKTIEQEANSAAVLEIFHSNENVIIQHLNEGLGDGASLKIKERLNIEEIKPFALKSPRDYLNEIEKIAAENKKDSVIFKIFPGHIKDSEKLKQIVLVCDCLVFLRRNTLHSYISNMKAIKVGTYSNVNTSHVKIDFDVVSFLNWRKNIYSFFNLVEGVVEENKKKSHYFNYEEIYSLKSNKIADLCNKLELCAFDLKNINSSLKKQDNSQNAHEKISNPHDLINFLNEYNLQLLDPSSNVDIYK